VAAFLLYERALHQMWLSPAVDIAVVDSEKEDLACAAVPADACVAPAVGGASCAER
jgi:hypothetical protein